MTQSWSDYLDTLKNGAQVIEFKTISWFSIVALVIQQSIIKLNKAHIIKHAWYKQLIETKLMSAQPQYITNGGGQKISVILSLADYQELLEDLEDLAAIAERKDETTIPWQQVKEELKINGLL